MKTVLMISDYIEGQPVVASVRYTGLMKYFAKYMNIVTINNKLLGEEQSKFSIINYKYLTPNNIYSQNFNAKESIPNKKPLEKLLRNRWVLSSWRNYKYNEYKFKQANRALFNKLDLYLAENTVDAIFVTVPDIYGLFILKDIKKKYPNLPAIVEVRDILNNKIGTGNPTFALKKAEKIMLEYSDGIIALSQGIYNYYKDLKPDIKITIIRNGYDHELFLDSKYESVLVKDNKLVLAHIGSIYKGRNIKEFIYGLMDFHIKTGIFVDFNIIGILDKEAIEGINEFKVSNGVNVNLLGTLPHKNAVEYLKKSNIAVIITHKKGSDYAIPGKAFEYIGACKPILAVTEDKELVSLIQSKYGECAEHDRKDIAMKLIDLINYDYHFSDRIKYSREIQAEKIIQYIMGVLSKSKCKV
ncbi:hypothetical protein J5Y03_07955 [Bacillus sp. RG28]|uniref:Glycosyl transferase family 1 domain-containing protein n=1 Tax=Gottfriedia endophytica TaxID=2820819 RepID=A0A940NIT7_9BACI|nr:hypothetical protein [Gottfriedia endophytica]MBP0725125.1 hypothetical protein [Gottfriedia endophytica]